jgi:UTP--glucose-1-phosphate uridylyltransferase
MSFQECRQKMERAGLDSWQIERFERDWLSLQAGEKGHLAESELRPVGEIQRLSDLSPGGWGGLAQTVVIKLNGGLGTSMGLESPKGLLEVRQGLSFLDLTRQQVEHLRCETGCLLPLLLMNSFYTQSATLARLGSFSNGKVPLDFLQSKVPKLKADDHQPVEFSEQPGLEWCPPGHGEIYSALKGSGLLQTLLDAGFAYAFVSNIDNLGATLDAALLQWFAQSGLDFAMEVTRRTQQDKKGGHLARLQDGRLVLRERAQCAQNDLAAFEDIDRHSFFNTNNLWLNLNSLQSQPLPQLPVIVNRKTVDPTNPKSCPVLQLESAMGAAISAFPKAAAIEVSRRRFLPVKTLADLLLLRSDLYRLNAQSELEAMSPERMPQISLDSRYYATYDDFARRFQAIPRLLQCRSLTVKGDIHFLESLDLVGDVELCNPEPLPMQLP